MVIERISIFELGHEWGLLKEGPIKIACGVNPN